MAHGDSNKPQLDPFTSKRLTRYVDSHRQDKAQLATLRDLEAAGFPKALVDLAVRQGLLTELYVTLTTGAVVKGYKTKR